MPRAKSVQVEAEPSGAVDPAALLDGLTDDMPEVQEHTIAAETVNKEPENTGNVAGAKLYDKSGNVFDPLLYESIDGVPQYTTAGNFKKKRGRKNTESVVGAPKHSESKIAVANPVESAEFAAKSAAAATFTVGTIIFGTEWQPVVDEKAGVNEPQTLKQAYQEYFESEGITKFPPWLGLCMALTCYAAPRLFAPVTKSRLQKAKDWIAAKYTAIRWRRHAHAHSRNDHKRQDDISKDAIGAS